ncbi:transmembrane protein 185B-like [Xenia sp. Carnegie-2017]|uniref:transmembrane protein 185B-like n=1 Tax=Xenia sp. Carnegie-2017 TaxID=2897299 RepID=UPI001F050237|nr:transmembrane protein 185B-like [Xenia sp. Carnegie-2017]
MNSRSLFQEFNPSKFMLFFLLIWFSVLLSLRLDGSITWSYWAVFLPIWLWKLITLIAGVSGIVVWLNNPQYRQDGDGDVEFKAMILSFIIHILLMFSEILLCNNIHEAMYRWTWAFTPIYIISPLSVIFCVWGLRNDRSVEFEMFFAVNILQFIFLSLKLDNVVNWSWAVVFVPTWIVMSFLCLLVVYYIIWSLLFLRSDIVSSAQKQNHLTMVTISLAVVIPLLVFEILLVNRLDGSSEKSFAQIMIPLQIALFTLLATSFCNRGGNHWWFGIRKDFCEYLLGLLPCLKEYGNTSYKFPESFFTEVVTEELINEKRSSININKSREAPCIVHIDVPD